MRARLSPSRHRQPSELAVTPDEGRRGGTRFLTRDQNVASAAAFLAISYRNDERLREMTMLASRQRLADGVQSVRPPFFPARSGAIQGHRSSNSVITSPARNERSSVRQLTGIETLATAGDFIDRPPPVAKVVVTLEVHTVQRRSESLDQRGAAPARYSMPTLGNRSKPGQLVRVFTAALASMSMSPLVWISQLYA
jgi:hypothetical protein